MHMSVRFHAVNCVQTECMYDPTWYMVLTILQFNMPYQYALLTGIMPEALSKHPKGCLGLGLSTLAPVKKGWFASEGAPYRRTLRTKSTRIVGAPRLSKLLVHSNVLLVQGPGCFIHQQGSYLFLPGLRLLLAQERQGIDQAIKGFTISKIADLFVKSYKRKVLFTMYKYKQECDCTQMSEWILATGRRSLLFVIHEVYHRQ